MSISVPLISDLIHKYDVFLFDCDGTLWSGSHEIQGVRKFLSILKQSGKTILLVSNNATKEPSAVSKKAQSFGFDVSEEQVITSGLVLKHFLREDVNLCKHNESCEVKQAKKFNRALVLGEQALVDVIQSIGIQTYGSPGPDSKDDLYLSPKYPADDVDCVIVGFDTKLNYQRISRAMRALARKDILFIATNCDPAIPSTEGIPLPGAGTTVAAVSTASERQPDFVMGKPSKMMWEFVKQRIKELRQSKKLSQSPPKSSSITATGLDLPSSSSSSSSSACSDDAFLLNIERRCLMIGDRLETDILFGELNGLDTLLVLTGIATYERMMESKIKPTFYVESLEIFSTNPEDFKT